MMGSTRLYIPSRKVNTSGTKWEVEIQSVNSLTYTNANFKYYHASLISKNVRDLI